MTKHTFQLDGGAVPYVPGQTLGAALVAAAPDLERALQRRFARHEA